LTDASQPARTRKTTTGADGSFAFTLGGLTPPYILKAQWTDRSGTRQLYAVAEEAGTTNINPFTDIAFVAAVGAADSSSVSTNPDAEMIRAASRNKRTIMQQLLNKLEPLFALYGTDSDPDSDHYDANHTGLDAMLDDIRIIVKDGMVIVTDRRTGKIIFKAPVNNIDAGTFYPENMPGQPGQIDGANLYASNCGSCHGSLASSEVAAASAADIQDAIDENTGGMGSLDTLTALQVQAIAAALAGGTTTPPPPPPTTTDGATLYADSCASCHGALASSNVKIRTASAITTAIDGNTGGMGTSVLRALSSAQIDAIAAALAGGTTPPPPAACTYTYSSWGTCQSNGTQSRSLLTTSPAGCTGTPVLTQTCTYVPPPPAACSYTYTSWGTCQSNNTQTRTVLTTSPAGCTGTPVLTQSCTYVAPIDGAALYSQYCASCHGNSKKGSSASATQTAIDTNRGGMGTTELRSLTPEQIAAISAAP
jgi:mono/diheme cytochrome c family protein